MHKETEIVSLDPGRIEDEKIVAIARVLNGDGVIAYPTDTFYGLGANCYSEKAVKKIYDLKGRDMSKALPVVIASRSMLLALVQSLPPGFDALAEKFWPGPLTIILKASRELPKIVTGGSGTIGVRFPNTAWLQALIRRAGFPLTATSANLSGGKEISDPSRLARMFKGELELIVDGGLLSGRVSSTVVDISSGGLSIVRKGAIPASALHRFQQKFF